MSEQKSFDFHLARVLSTLFHPIWLPLVYISIYHWNKAGFPTLFLIASLCLVIFPGLVALSWMFVRKEVDFFVMERSNRIVPLVATILGLAFFAVANGGFLPDNLFQGELMAICILLVFISLLITLFWKISLHMIGWGAVVGFAIAMLFQLGEWPLLAASVPISIVVAWARMRLGSHDLPQIIVGFSTGIAAAILIAIAFP